MPFGTIILQPGVKKEVTPTLNKAGISSSNLIRFMAGLPQKIGGWTKYSTFLANSVIRELWSWEDLSGQARLAEGAQDELAVITNGISQTITPQSTTRNLTNAFSTTIGSNIITIDDVGSSMTTLDVVVFNTPVSIGGLILNGTYQIATVASPDQFTILAASNAGSMVTAGGAVPLYSTTSGAFTVQVTLADHGYSAGSSYAAIASTTVGGLVIQGLYTVTSVIDANNFNISLPSQANATTTGSMNGGQAQLVYWITAIPPALGTGFGIGTFGSGGFGTGIAPASHTGTPITTTDWSLDNWGEFLIASPEDGPIFSWSPNSGYRSMQIIVNAPIANGGVFVAMPQQQLVAWGASVLGIQDPLEIKWCNVSDFDTWTASSTNQAGSYRLPRGSAIIRGMQGPQQGLFWTDLGVWSMQYIGPSLVYGFNELGSGCGLIAKKAVTILGSTIYWMSQKSFFVLINGNVQPLPCDVWDVVFQDLDTSNLARIRAGSNTQFNEVVWYFPSLSGSGENDSYVKLDTLSGAWDYGSLARTAWLNQSVLGGPIGADPSGYCYQHELTNNADGAAINSWFETGWFMIAEGEEKVFLDWLIPDFKYGLYNGAQIAEVKITIKVADYPWETPATFGPYTVSAATPSIPLRARGRYMSFRVESDDLDSFWRLGGCKYRFAQDGRV
jgi:hypothetical protein